MPPFQFFVFVFALQKCHRTVRARAGNFAAVGIIGHCMPTSISFLVHVGNTVLSGTLPVQILYFFYKFYRYVLFNSFFLKKIEVIIVIYFLNKVFKFSVKKVNGEYCDNEP